MCASGTQHRSREVDDSIVHSDVRSVFYGNLEFLSSCQSHRLFFAIQTKKSGHVGKKIVANGTRQLNTHTQPQLALWFRPHNVDGSIFIDGDGHRARAPDEFSIFCTEQSTNAIRE